MFLSGITLLTVYFSLSSSDCSMSARMISVFLSGGSVILKMTAETARMSLLNVVSISSLTDESYPMATFSCT